VQILGLGFDLFVVERMQAQLAREGQELATELFTPAELATAGGRGARGRRLAVLFAGKEAVAKAFSLAADFGSHWREIELFHTAGDRPRVALSGRFAALAAARGVTHIHLALASTRCLAAATAVLESNPGSRS